MHITLHYSHHLEAQGADRGVSGLLVHALHDLGIGFVLQRLEAALHVSADVRAGTRGFHLSQADGDAHLVEKHQQHCGERWCERSAGLIGNQYLLLAFSLKK